MSVDPILSDTYLRDWCQEFNQNSPQSVVNGGNQLADVVKTSVRIRLVGRGNINIPTPYSEVASDNSTR